MLRHVYTTFALKSGDSPKNLQENLGHAAVAFPLNVYGHVLEEIEYESASNSEKVIQGLLANRAYPELAVSNG